MSEPVDPAEIEGIVGARRHASRHQARAVSDSRTVYVLHPRTCLNWHERRGLPLTSCPFSRALDRGIVEGPFAQEVRGGRLKPHDDVPAALLLGED